MTPVELSRTAEQLIAAIAQLIPGCMENPADRDNANGNVAVMIVAEGGEVFGRMFGSDNRRRREIGQIAWKKATQVWLTGQPTGRFEELVYSRQVNPEHFGIIHPDLIGWEGGLPVIAADGTKLGVGMSGFMGATDCSLVRRAVALVPGLRLAE